MKEVRASSNSGSLDCEGQDAHSFHRREGRILDAGEAISRIPVECFECYKVFSAPAREEDGDAVCPHCGAL